MINIVPLILPIEDLQLREEYAQLVPTAFHCCLDGQDPFGINSPVLGVGAIEKGHPIAVAFATAHMKIHSADIHLLAIADDHAQASLVKDILEFLTQLLINQGMKLATFTYTHEDPSSDILEQAFTESQWQGPQPFMVTCLFRHDNFDPNWWNKNVPLKEGFQEFLFENLTRQEEKDLIHRFEQMTIPSHIYPFGSDKNLIEYKNSLGLRYKGKVIGWMITHRIEPNVIRYSSLYLEDEFADTRYWLKLLIDSLRLHDAPYGILEINLNQISKRWLKFIERRLFPHASKITHKQMFWKNLEAG